MGERRHETRFGINADPAEIMDALRTKGQQEENKLEKKDITPETTWEEFRKNKQAEGANAETFLAFVRAKAESRGLPIEAIPKMGELGMVEITEEGRKAFRELARLAITELATHGMTERGPDGKMTLKTFSDTDGDACIYLCKLAGIVAKKNKKMGTEATKITYVDKGQGKEGAMVMDTSGREGVQFDAETETLYIDHHGDESPTGTSTAGYLYDTLWRAGLIDLDNVFEAAALEGAIEFVSAVDNGEYPGMHNPKAFLQSSKTMLGLSPYLNFTEIVDFFKKYRDPLEVLTDRQINEWNRGSGESILSRAEKRQERVENSINAIISLKAAEFDVESDKLGRILVDIGKQVPMGRDAAFGMGFDTYLMWNPDDDSFFVQSKKPLNVRFDQGFVVREKMWMKPRDGVALKITLKEVLEMLTGGEVKARGKLAEYLENGGENRENETDDPLKAFTDVLVGEPSNAETAETTLDAFTDVLEGGPAKEQEVETVEEMEPVSREQVLPIPSTLREGVLAETPPDMEDLAEEHQTAESAVVQDEVHQIMEDLRLRQALDEAEIQGEQAAERSEAAVQVAQDMEGEYRVLRFMNGLRSSWKRVRGWFNRTFG
ncbi:MAG: hypothetical protein UW35_C0034G0003 [Candidatus Collierbacteria bacterium GW2011_GWF2_44_15]|uniref:Uncharacterized protein n=1 Tax=Candidatus Collierbacteria bacterium GW2011_GWF2_44_15 TaxID=1618404 RepID=A0A0G1KCW7_9BACT|nr:MAG: hypothetical protein UW35_C0034G0003 [Candidatus Collierbacteria bacterium GW2011_GWF2_44_15]